MINFYSRASLAQPQSTHTVLSSGTSLGDELPDSRFAATSQTSGTFLVHTPRSRSKMPDRPGRFDITDMTGLETRGNRRPRVLQTDRSKADRWVRVTLRTLGRNTWDTTLRDMRDGRFEMSSVCMEVLTIWSGVLC